ncbi:Exopolysaccharide production protein ExoY [Neochlamydia sp. EPS4]|nr:Exopolysaccharide production protein ExoY [Neochlamydia sp. EPS4]
MVGKQKIMDNSPQWMQESTALRFSPSLGLTVKRNPTKRLFDIIFSLCVLIITLPVLAIVAISVYFSSKGKIIYSQERIGRGGKPFRCYKFRTMYPDADARLDEILESSLELKREWANAHKLKNDPRVTPIGKFLRKTSLDEFPQFVNVLKGDLSVVGPRPVVQYEVVRHLGYKATKILSVRPGVTGLWQVSGRSDISYANRIKLDEQYIESQSLLLDIKIIAKTIPIVCFPRGAY